ncbi:short-subunit dehydrogenase [Streptomyces echinatus]|uniref:Short-subunit dehydrogenase n=1 Tax=Streptomyces echinatus TaxID=67293 RepID=A0A7W9UVT8_9ACTN|nr:short-subunit dehydrogenase [Streptomyces echinatus]
MVCNAGFAVTGRFATVPLEQSLEMMGLNCDALVALAHAFWHVPAPGTPC